MPDCYFSVGATLAALTNVEAIVTFPPTVLPERAVPLVGPIRRRTLDQLVQRNGAIDTEAAWDIFSQTDLNALILSIFADYTTASKAYYASWIDETGNYSPFAVTFERPTVREHYQIVNATWRRELIMPGLNWVLQTVTKTGNYTVTTSDRLIYANTAGGSITLTLPAANSPNANTVFSFIKTSAANSMIIARAGADTIDAGTSITKTAIHSRVNIVSDKVSAWTSIAA